MKLGFIGLGVMGSSMAQHLLQKGYSLTVFNRSLGKTKPFEGTAARIASSYEDCARDLDILFTCLGDGASVREVLLGEHGAAKSMKTGALVVDHSTISPTEAEEIGEKLKALGIHFLDAPVTGGDLGAKKGTLTTFVGGEKELFEYARPVLTAYCSKLVHVGPVGFGQKLKAVNQIGSIGGVALVSEMLAFGTHLGIDPALCVDALQEGAAGSFVLRWLGPRIAEGDFKPGFSVKHSRKDMRIVLAEAERLGLKLRLSPDVLQALDRVAEFGADEAGNHSMYLLIRDKE